MTPDAPDSERRALTLDLARVTEAGAIACAPLVGAGDKEAADQAAVDGMRRAISSVRMDGVVVIGEGEKDEAPMLYNGEAVGDGSGPALDVAVDPLEGTTLAAQGMPNALAMMALAERDTMFDPGPCVYMEKLAGAGEVADLLDLDRPMAETAKLVAERKGKPIEQIQVIMLDRERHKQVERELHEAGARVRLILHGDVSAVMQAVLDEYPIDLLWGIGGTPEGVLGAAAIKSIGGDMVGRLWPRDDEERRAALDAGYDLERQLRAGDLVTGDDVLFAATGVSDGDVLDGVRAAPGGGATTESVVMRSDTGTVRRIAARHSAAKVAQVRGGG